jgi:hypothetical protein
MDNGLKLVEKGLIPIYQNDSNEKISKCKRVT